MANIFRKPDSTSLFVEIIDATLHDKEIVCDLYKQIEAYLVKEYIEQNRQEIMSKVDMNKLIKEMQSSLATELIKQFLGNKGEPNE